MRRIITLLFALLIALWGLSILTAGEPSTLVALRDGMFVLLSAAVLFALASRPLRDVWASKSDQAPLPMTAAVLAVLGLTTGIGGGAWLLSLLRAGTDDASLLWALITWSGGILLLGIAALWPQRTTAQGDPVVWSVSAAEDYLQRAAQDAPTSPSSLSRRAVVIGVLLVTAVAALMRIWNFAGLPAGCVDDCTGALQALTFLREDSWRSLLLADAPLYTLLLALVFGIFEPGMSTLGWLGMGLGIVSVPLFYAAARAVARPPVAFVGALLLAFAPWHIVLSRIPEAATLLVFLIAATIWACGWATTTGQPQRWALAGLLAGISTLTASGWISVALLLWWLLAIPPAHWRDRLLYWAGILVGGALTLVRLSLEMPTVTGAGSVTARVVSLLEGLADGTSALTAITAVLALLGLAHLLRRPRWSATRLLVVGFVVLALLALYVAPDTESPLRTSLFFVLITLTALVALDQIVGALIEEWAIAVRPVTLTGVTAVASTILLAFVAVNGLQQADGVSAGPATSSVVGKYLQEHFERSVDNGGEETDVFFVPFDLLHAPATQLAAGGVLPFAKRILPLDVAKHLPPATSPFVDLPTDGDIRYVIPVQDRALLDYVGRIYPNYVGETIAEPDSGMLAAYVATVPREQIEGDRGLTVTYFALDTDDFSAELPAEADALDVAGPLEFTWDDAPLSPPFAMRARGMLYVPETGPYLFSAETDDDAQLRVILGNEIQSWTLVDTVDGTVAGTVTMPQGYLPIEIEYRSSSANPALSIRWQRPEGKVEPIPRQALYQNAIPMGVLATYYPTGIRLEDIDEADPIEYRREPLLQAGPVAVDAGVVVWEAKIAAPVDGSYLFTAEANGRFDLSINGITLADAASALAEQETFEQVAAAVQLRRGWHDLLIRYEPEAGAPSFVLRWQPMGYQESEIPATLLAPYEADIDVTALAIPDVPLEVSAPPPMSAFELPDVLQSEDNPLPTGLPELPLQLMWTAGSCNEEGFQPRGVMVWPDRNLLLATDVGNARVMAYDLATGEIADIYTDDAWVEPFDLGRNLLGDVYLLDAVAQQIYRIAESGTAFAPIALETSFYRPRGMGVSADGSLVVADTGGARVVVLTEDGDVRAQYGGPDTALGQGQPVDALLQPNGALWVVTAEDGQLWRLDQGNGQASTARANTFTGPHLASLPNNGLLVTDPERRLLTLYSPGGVAVAQFQEGGFMTPVGIDAANVNDQLLLAIGDSGACEVSLWQMPLADLP
jgi:sugar lactone lactonase YvrE